MRVKQIFFLLAMILLSSTVNAQAKTANISIKTSIYCDHCKKCESCGKRLETAAFSEKGVKRVDIDEKTKTVTVIYNPQKTSPEKLRQAIANAGYDADDVKGNQEAYAKWDGCCQK